MSLYGIYTSGLGALGQSLKLDMLANNLANVSTPGFRRDQISFRERLVEALEDRPDLNYYNALVHRNGGAPFIDGVRFDEQPGGFERTNRPLDLALNSKGFFAVRDRETGNVYYTRAGDFTRNAEGLLVTSDGRYQALSQDGAGIAFQQGGSPDVRVDADGRITQGQVEVARLGVIDFDDYGRLFKHGDNLFENGGAAFVEPAEVHVEQGTLEGSSANPVTEMVDMIKTMRALESNLQMIRFQDATLERSVNDFGRTPR